MSTRAELLEQLRELRVETVTAEYNGEGDDGQIGEPEFGAVEIPDGLTTALQDLLYEVLDDLYSGWENNEGSRGQFIWNVGEDRIHLVHSTRFNAYETEERDL